MSYADLRTLIWCGKNSGTGSEAGSDRSMERMWWNTFSKGAGIATEKENKSR
jgi:hypothetical protein